MADIRIRRLTLENFKCHKALTLDFEGRDRSLYGDNAAGKTSVYDALTWLLFGKDSAGGDESRMEVKPLNEQGQTADPQAMTAVEAELEAGGDTVTFRRCLRGLWGCRAGGRETEFLGNSSRYYVNGLALRKGAFDAAVRELVPEDRFRMLTSVTWFARDLDWQQRRQILFDLSGAMTDRELLASEPGFADLLEQMGSRTPEEYRAWLLERRKALSGIPETISARLSECEKILASLGPEEGPDRQGEIAGRLEAVTARLKALDSGDRRELTLRLDGAKLECRELEARNREHRMARDRERAGLEGERKARQQNILSIQALIGTLEGTVQDLRARQDRCRERWTAVNGGSFPGGNCPTCGQSLPQPLLQEAANRFQREKAASLTELDRQIRDLEGQLERTRNRLQAQEQALVREREAVDRLDRRLRDFPRTEDLEDFPARLQAVRDRAAELAEALSRLDREDRRESLEQERADLERQLERVRQAQARDQVRQTTRDRMDQLRREAEQTRQAQAQVQAGLKRLEDFSRWKAGQLEKQVNGFFRLARFRLFRRLANGGLEERCDVVCGGVPYAGLNNGARINVGIDIINALSRHYGVWAPLFIDNAESVTRLEPCMAQTIRLVVSPGDRQLRLE